MRNIFYLILFVSVFNKSLFSTEFFLRDPAFDGKFVLLNKSLNVQKKTKSPFRYVIYDGQVVGRYKSDASKRYVFVLMEKNAFSPANLSDLFNKLSLKYSTPVNMEIYVYTDLQQTVTPEEAEDRSPGISESARENPVIRFPYAIYFRSKSGAYFQYTQYTDTPPQIEFKKVTIN